ncbi:group 1 truncated hemoglobin [Streptomyces sp. NPDC001228]|uniref:group I truncated hemoglobin n=1 Tax=Streptomyces sp. NPDC001228 TaxID=3154381 RepID=UPI0033239171
MTDTDTARGGITPALPQKLRAADPESPSFYARIGGAPTVRRIVDDLYIHVLSDRRLSPYFDGSDLPALKRHMVLLLTGVLGGPKGRSAHDLVAAHRGLDISGEHYDRVGHVLLGVLWENDAGVDAVIHVARVLAAVKELLVPGLGDEPARSA